MTGEPWRYQLRVYLPEAEARAARDGRLPGPLAEVLRRHEAIALSQLDAFEAYVAEAEREGVERYPLYRWTKATVADAAMRAKHGGAFAIRVRGAEVYDKAEADALEVDLRPLVDDGVVERLTRHDTDPEKNIPVPPEYRG